MMSGLARRLAAAPPARRAGDATYEASITDLRVSAESRAGAVAWFAARTASGAFSDFRLAP
ncbi:MAG: hypothetical protein PHU25_02205 [Deltaproteobacteria bacterium]|nr:hypothetical protein [Deltaproteobacteria bacterium]